MIKGEIKEIQFSSSIITLIIDNGTNFDDRIEMDYRMYSHIENDKSHPIGKKIEYDGEQIYFKEDE